jgi:Golgi apparatus protein 1
MKLIFLFMLSFAAFANECEQEQKKYCQGIDPGRGQIARCLSDYKDYLSPRCAKTLQEFKSKTNAKNPCHEDLAEFCSDIPSDPLNFDYCLLRHETRLSPTCAADFKAKKGRIIVRNVCAQDIASTCYSQLSEPDGAVTRCLIKNKGKLGGFCQKNIDYRVAQMKKTNPCFEETEKFCPTQLKFIDIQDCLSQRVKTLSADCKKLVTNEIDKMKANPCYRDLRTHCKPGLNPKDQSDCLTLNDNHLSNSCKQFRVLEQDKVGKMEKMCEQDRLKLCKDAPFKDGAILKCLRKNKSQVSRNCSVLL